MGTDHLRFLEERLAPDNFEKIAVFRNAKLNRFIAETIELCRPSDVFVATDAAEDIAKIRRLAVERGEEAKLRMDGHTVHFDGYNDQSRDKDNTRYLLPSGVRLSKRLASTDKTAGLNEIRSFLDGAMQNKTMIVRFFCLGPTNSDFSISCVQITDSFYVAHSEDILYRSGYEQFKRVGGGEGFFRFLHSAGDLDEKNCSRNIDRRRVYMDLDDEIVYSVNTQYAGNTVGLKKLALRLGIRRAHREGWLAEHMFILGVNGPGGRRTYFSGAFPSACGKTSTAMIGGQKIVGDDIGYLRKSGGEIRIANVESGIFGIIEDVNAKDDPVIYDVLTSAGEVIFSNVLVRDGRPYWTGMGVEIPNAGTNHSGEWQKGKQDGEQNEIPPSHKNARYTVRLRDLKNLDEHADDPAGVLLEGIIYGGRDSDTSVPVAESFDWAHGVIAGGGSLESETTAATLGKQGVRKFNIMSNMDFLSMPLGAYLKMHLDFASGVEKLPRIFTVNYFLKGKDGKFMNGKLDKKVWILWAERRVHGDVGAIATPIGSIPKYDDLRELFRATLDKDYSRDDYAEQFAIRIPELLAKNARVAEIYRSETDVPDEVFRVLDAQAARLAAARTKYGDYVSPFTF